MRHSQRLQQALVYPSLYEALLDVHVLHCLLVKVVFLNVTEVLLLVSHVRSTLIFEMS